MLFGVKLAWIIARPFADWKAENIRQPPQRRLLTQL